MQFEHQMTSAVEKLSESVVNISSLRLKQDLRFGLVPLEGAGSGIIVSSQGNIVTNNHVIDNASQVHVTLKDGRSFVGDVIGGDQFTDIALVKIKSENLPVAELGDSENLKVGQIAIAAGNALGLPGAPTISTGVISALNRPLSGAHFIFEGLLQTDASINPGNSGGPLSDLNGNVIGINTAMISSAQGVGFAIPVNTVKNVISQLSIHGRVIRPWIGISGLSITSSISRKYDLYSDHGVLIIEISYGSPAYESGLRNGDIITAINDNSVSSMNDLILALSKFKIGENVNVSLIRMNKRYESSIKLIENASIPRLIPVE